MKRNFSASIIIFITNIIVGFVLVLISLRVILKLFGANPNTSFVQWVYETTNPLLSLFSGIFPSPVISNGFVVDFTSLFALIIYALLAYLIYQLVNFLAYTADKRFGHKEEGVVFGVKLEDEDETEQPRKRGRRRIK